MPRYIPDPGISGSNSKDTPAERQARLKSLQLEVSSMKMLYCMQF